MPASIKMHLPHLKALFHQISYFHRLRFSHSHTGKQRGLGKAAQANLTQNKGEAAQTQGWDYAGSDAWKLNSVPASVHLKVTPSKPGAFPSFPDCQRSPTVLESLLPALGMQDEHGTHSQRCQQNHQGQNGQANHCE